MRRSLRIAVGIAGFLFVPLVVRPPLGPLSIVGCSSPRGAHWVGTSFDPPAPNNCLQVCINVTALAGEVLQIHNGCARDALTLTGSYFAPAGMQTFSWDGAVTAFTDSVGPGQSREFIATPAADRMTTLSMTGTLGGTFETLTITVADGGVEDAAREPLCVDAGQGVSSETVGTGSDAGAERDARIDERDARIEKQKEAGKSD